MITSMFSICSGSRSSKREMSWPPTLIVPDDWLLFTRTPSMITSGLLVNETELDPRMRIREAAPAVPPACITVTPATRPLSNCDALLTAGSGTSSATLMFPVEAPLSRLSCCSPVAVVVTTSRSCAVTERAKSAVTSPDAGTVMVRLSAW